MTAEKGKTRRVVYIAGRKRQVSPSTVGASRIVHIMVPSIAIVGYSSIYQKYASEQYWQLLGPLHNTFNPISAPASPVLGPSVAANLCARKAR